MKVLVFIIAMLSAMEVEAKRLDSKRVIKICEDYRITKEFKSWSDNCELIAGIAKVETHYRSRAFNPEKTGSYGLLQIQCATARMMGLKFSCNQLFDPRVNIRFGMKYILYLRRAHSIVNIKPLISAWNAGSPIYCKDYNLGKCYPGEFINQKYVWKVSRHYRYLIDQAKLYLTDNP